MPPLFDEMQIHNALRAEALPALERLADNSRLRDRTLGRFDRDEPPPYESSTDDEEYAMFHPALGLDGDAVLDEFKDIMDAPLSSHERFEVGSHLHRVARVYDPEERYRAEARIEEARLDSFYRLPSDDGKRYLHFADRAGRERLKIIVRRNIKRRWQKLGVWNSQWGIPDRLNNPQPSDNPSGWKWRWEEGSSAAQWNVGPDGTLLTSPHPIMRAVRLRQGLHRDECSPVPPRSYLQDDASTCQAESFIISRPWFIYDAELSEERMRLYRIPLDQRRHYKKPISKHVIEQWKLRGDWREDWKDPGGKFIPGWKWRHESPSPEPEDLTPLNPMNMEFTPSEVDALEAVPPPTPAPEPRCSPPSDPHLGPRTGLFAGLSIPPDLTNNSLEAPAHRPPSLPHRRQRKRRNENLAQPLRRSARIAARKAKRPQPPL